MPLEDAVQRDEFYDSMSRQSINGDESVNSDPSVNHAQSVSSGQSASSVQGASGGQRANGAEELNENKAHRRTVARVLNTLKPSAVLDICCGDGWLPRALTQPTVVDGIDFYESAPEGYAQFQTADFLSLIHI